MADDKKNKLALIATLPKSGTWYSHTFFWCYDQLLKNSQAYLAGEFQLDLAKVLKNREILSKTMHSDTLQIDRMYICHTICPGYYELKDNYSQRWQALHFPIVGYNWGEGHIRSNSEWDMLSPQINPDVKIVYLYRNPLDHFVSYFRHGQGHVDDRHRFKALKDGTRVAINNLHEHIFNFGALGAFIKHYYTYAAMHARFPNNILMVPYENLTSSPEDTFYKILSFIGAEPSDPTQYRLFKDALSACSKESLMTIEEKHNISLANDLVNGDRHIRGGEVGKWKKHLSQHELESIELALNAFDISLKDFILEEGKQAEVCLPWLTNFSSNKYLSEFFVNQMGDMGAVINQQTEKLEEFISKNKQEIESANLLQRENLLEKLELLECQKTFVKHIEALQLKVDQVNAEISSLLSSKSWRITSPLRFGVGLYRKYANR